MIIQCVILGSSRGTLPTLPSVTPSSVQKSYEYGTHSMSMSMIYMTSFFKGSGAKPSCPLQVLLMVDRFKWACGPVCGDTAQYTARCTLCHPVYCSAEARLL